MHPLQNNWKRLFPAPLNCLLQGKGGSPLHPINRAAFRKIKGDESQMCAAMALFTLYPPRLVVVRTPAGTWEIVY
jgi:hypothetical protein